MGRRNRRVSHCQAGKASCSQPSRRARELWGSRDLMDFGFGCSVTVATDSQSVIDHSKHRGHSVASKHVRLRGLWLLGGLVDGKLELEKVDTGMNPADVCTKSLLGDRIRELCRLARVCVCCSKGTMGDDPNEWYLSRMDELCRCEKFEQSCDAESKGAFIPHVPSVVIILTSHLQFDELVDPKCRTRSIMEKGFMRTAVGLVSIQLSSLVTSECSRLVSRASHKRPADVR